MTDGQRRTARPDNGPLIVDVHAHHFPAGLPDRSRLAGCPRWPSLVAGADGGGRIMQGEDIFRKVRRPLWDVSARLAELDAAGVGLQVVSPVPVTLTYWADAKQATAYTRELNDALAADVVASDGRLIGLGGVPLQDVDAAVEELDRIMGMPGMNGAEIGTVIAGRELDDPVLRPFFGAAQSLGAALFVHPMDGGTGVIRRTGQPYEFGMGMLTDTAMAAAALVFGGVLDDFPELRIALAHGCGAFPWVYPRLRLGAGLVSDRPGSAFDELVRSLWVDALVFDPEHLRLLTRRFGSGHIMVGTDHPFFPGLLEDVPDLVRAAAAQKVITPKQATSVLGTNALDFLHIKH